MCDIEGQVDLVNIYGISGVIVLSVQAALIECEIDNTLCFEN